MLFEKIHLESDETILLIVRRHWFVFLTRIIGILFSAFVPFTLIFAALRYSQTSGPVSTVLSTYSNEILFFGALWLLVNWMILAYVFTDHYLDLWVVTDRRIISIDQKSLFVRSIGSFRLERLQDLNIEIPGFLATMFNFGNIEAQTASGSEEEFAVRGLPNPRKIKALILKAADIRMKRHHNMHTTHEGL